MKYIFTPVIQAHLATVLLIAISMGAYGCADSATVNPVVELASLTVTPGTLQPTFNRSTTQYSVDLTSNIATVTITAQPAVAGDTVKINGVTTTSRVITLGAEGTTTSVNIVVSESDSNSRTYTVLITRAGSNGNNSLQNLNVSPGTLAPTFDANTLPYTVNVTNSVGSVEVTPSLQDMNATMTVNGQNAASGASITINLTAPGTNTTIEIIVTAQNGNQKPYLVTVSRGISSNANLQNLTITPGTLNPAFNAGTAVYSVNVASTVASVVVTPTLQDTTATMTVNGTPTTSGQARSITLLAPGSNTFINVKVTAENGSQNNYVVVVTRVALGDNNLSALTISSGSLSPSFTPNTTDYAVNVTSDVTSLDVSATKTVPAAVMLIGSVTIPAGTASGQETFPLNGAGTQTIISISVTAPNGGTPKTYTVTVNRAASSNDTLSALTVTANAIVQPLAPDFNATILTYTVNVATDVDTVTVSATKSDLNAVMLIGSVTIPAGTASGEETFPLSGPGTQTLLSISVTAQSGGAPKTYTVTVNRAASSDDTLSALTVTANAIVQPLVPDFNPTILTYTVNVATDVDTVTVSASKSDPNAVMLIGSVTIPAGTASGEETFPLSGPGTQTLLSISVTAQSGGAPKTYSITVDRALGP